MKVIERSSKQKRPMNSLVEIISEEREGSKIKRLELVGTAGFEPATT
jgi:hypothetical protein